MRQELRCIRSDVACINKTSSIQRRLTWTIILTIDRNSRSKFIQVYLLFLLTLSRLFHSFIADGLMDFAGGKRIRFQHQSLSMFCPRMEVRWVTRFLLRIKFRRSSEENRYINDRGVSRIYHKKLANYAWLIN